MDVNIVQAIRPDDHNTIVRLARTSKYTRDFSNIMFSSEAAYAKGWIRVARHGDEIVGFTCVRHKTRAPETMLYFIGVEPEYIGRGVGQALMRDLEKQTLHPRIALKVEKENKRAVAFYERLGYVVESTEAYGGKGLLMAKVLREGTQ